MKVDFDNRKYWKSQKCNNLIKPANLLVKSTSDILCNFVFIFHWDDAWSNQVEIHWDDAWSNRPNWVEMHWDDAWSNWVEMHWDDAQFDQFDQALITGGIGWNPLRLCLVKSVEFDQCKSIWVIISVDFHPIQPVINAWLNWVKIHWDDAWSNRSNWVEIHWDDAWSNCIEMMPGRIGWKSIEMMLGRIALRWCLVKLGGNPLRWCLVELHWDDAWSNWVEIHWDDAWSNWASSASYAWSIRPGIISMDFHTIWPPNSTRQAYNVISMDFHPIHWDDAWSNRSNWVEIHWDDAWSDWASSASYALSIRPGIISIDFHPIHWDDAWSNWSNWVEIPLDYAWSNWSN